LIGIFGGVFDPIHIGHLRIAIDALEKYKLSHIRFIPCKISVDKRRKQTSINHRLAMLKLALKPYKKFILDTTEITRHTPSYMLLTLKQLQQEFPKEKLGLMIGADRVPTLHRWYKYKEILQIAELIIMPRELAVSSTKIRKNIQLDINSDYLLPNSVLKYIHQHHLYAHPNK